MLASPLLSIDGPDGVASILSSAYWHSSISMSKKDFVLAVETDVLSLDALAMETVF